MKNNLILGCMLAALITAGATGCATDQQKQAELQTQARVSREQALQMALAKVPDGTVKSGELEKEKGKLIWSFDIATPASKNITEVAVDAVTGIVLSVEQETPKQQANEKD